MVGKFKVVSDLVQDSATFSCYITREFKTPHIVGHFLQQITRHIECDKLKVFFVFGFDVLETFKELRRDNMSLDPGLIVIFCLFYNLGRLSTRHHVFTLEKVLNLLEVFGEHDSVLLRHFCILHILSLHTSLF